jgi:hypothetical protein
MKIHNERGAGRKPLPYATKQKRIPVPLEKQIDELIKSFKQSQQAA